MRSNCKSQPKYRIIQYQYHDKAQFMRKLSLAYLDVDECPRMYTKLEISLSRRLCMMSRYQDNDLYINTRIKILILRINTLDLKLS